MVFPSAAGRGQIALPDNEDREPSVSEEWLRDPLLRATPARFNSRGMRQISGFVPIRRAARNCWLTADQTAVEMAAP